MEDRDARTFEMLTSVRDFGTEHADLFPDGQLHAQFAALGTLVTELQQYVGKQASGKLTAKQSSAGKSAARERLRESLAAISRTARTMALDTPGLAEAFAMPPRNDAALVAAARAFLTNAAPLKDRFIEYEMPEDVLEQLEANLADFESTINSQHQSKEQHVNATATIEDLLARGQKIVRQLDTLISNKFRQDTAMLAAWQSASHTKRNPESKTRKQEVVT